MAKVRGFGRTLTVELVEVTPRKAEDWLGANTRNRRSRDRKIAQYARDMEAGKWSINGEPIIFAKGGRLLDGQNRLFAVVESGTTIVSLVVRGVDGAAQETMDTGATRTLADVLRLRGEVNAFILAATLRKLVAYERTGIPYSQRSGATVNESITFLNRYPDIRESVRFSMGNKNGRKVIQPTDIATLHFLFSRVNEQSAEDFFVAVGGGVGLRDNDPVYILRETMMKERISEMMRIPPMAQTAIVIKAFNSWYRGHEIRFLRFMTKETFPKIAGSENVLFDAQQSSAPKEGEA